MRENGYSLYTDATIGRQIKFMNCERVRIESISNEQGVPLYSARMNDGRFQIEARTVLVSFRLLIVGLIFIP